MNDDKQIKLVGDHQEAQKASLNACPADVSNHKNDQVQPIAGKVVTGFKPA